MSENIRACRFFGHFQGFSHLIRTKRQQILALKRAIEQILLVQHKRVRHIIYGAANGDATQHCTFLARRLGLPSRFNEGELGQNRLHLQIGNQTDFHRVFQVQQGIANVVCRFHQIRQGVSYPAVLAIGKQTQLCRNSAHIRQLGLVNIEFFVTDIGL